MSAPKIISLVAQNPVGSVYGNGDTISVTFDVATDQAGLTVHVQQSRIIVNSIFKFFNYSAQTMSGRGRVQRFLSLP